MDRARFGGAYGQLVTPERFLELAGPGYLEAGQLPTCDGCGQVVHICGARSLVVPSRFDHPDLAQGVDPLDDCMLARRSARLRGLETREYDEVRGLLMKRDFFEDANLRAAYAFCLCLCRAGNVPMDTFKGLLDRANHHRIWAYVGVELWAIPFLLLTLGNFEAISSGGRRYGFHFVLRKPRGADVSALWRAPGSCSLAKVFSADGEMVRTRDNPCAISHDEFLRKAGDASWISPGFLRALKA